MSAARLVNVARGRPGQIASIDAITQDRAAGLLRLSRATVQRAQAIVKDLILAPAVDAGTVSVSDAYAVRHEADEARRRALAAVADGSARTLRGALEREAAGRATVGLGSIAPAADQATGQSEPSRDEGDARRVMASPAAPASSAGGSGAPSAPEAVETSTASATDSEAHRLVASEPGGSGAADPAAGWTPFVSASSSDSGSSGSVPPSVRDRESGGAEASPDSAAVAGREAGDVHAEGVDKATAARSACDADAEPRRSTAGSTDSGTSDGAEATDAAGARWRSDSGSSSDSVSGGGAIAEREQQPAGPAGGVGGADVSRDSAGSAVVGREAAHAHVQGVDVASAAHCDADAERRRYLSALRSAAVGLGAVSRVGTPARFEATCGLVQTLVAAMERCLEAALDEQVLVADLPAELVRCLDAQPSTDTLRGASTQDEGNPDGRGRGSAPLEPESTRRAWLQRFGLNRSGLFGEQQP